MGDFVTRLEKALSATEFHDLHTAGHGIQRFAWQQIEDLIA
jgi:hypothetical protein